LTVPLSVKQFTGTVPPQLASAGNGNHMYFYTSIDDGLKGTYNFETELFYKNPWLGTINSENKLVMAHRADSIWTAYDATSTLDANRNSITATELNRFGY